MRPEVRAKMLEIAEVFVSHLKVEDFRILDVVLAGSMANFNWTDYSDLDLHVVTDYDDVDAPKIVEEFYSAKKNLWNDRHDISIRDHEVELYVEDDDNPPQSSGLYSILKNDWVNKPDHDEPDISPRAINRKVRDLIHRIDSALEQADSPDDIQRLIDKIYKMRQNGLAEGGEWSVENLAFKILRNMGYLNRLFKTLGRKQDSELSI